MGDKKKRRLGEKLDNYAVCRRFHSTCTANNLTKEALGAFGDFKIGGKEVRTVKHADDLVLLA
jgi:hypothetical protein